MESKDNRGKMIEIDYFRDPESNQNIEVLIHSFIVVGSVSYLLDIANFFVPDQTMTKEWKKDSLQDIPDVLIQDSAPEEENLSKLIVYLKIDEPDIFLVENIADSNSDALMLNTEVQFKYWSVPQVKYDPLVI